MSDIESAAQKVWDYLKIGQPLKKADVIILFGSHDPAVSLPKWSKGE